MAGRATGLIVRELFSPWIQRVEHRGVKRDDKTQVLFALSKCEPICAMFGLAASNKCNRSVPCLFSQCPLGGCFVPSGKSNPPWNRTGHLEQARVDLCPANSRDASAPRQNGQCDCLVQSNKTLLLIVKSSDRRIEV